MLGVSLKSRCYHGGAEAASACLLEITDRAMPLMGSRYVKYRLHLHTSTLPSYISCFYESSAINENYVLERNSLGNCKPAAFRYRNSAAKV